MCCGGPCSIEGALGPGEQGADLVVLTRNPATGAQRCRIVEVKKSDQFDYRAKQFKDTLPGGCTAAGRIKLPPGLATCRRKDGARACACTP